MNGAKPYLYRDILPTSLGEFVYIIEIHNDEDFLAQLVADSPEQVIKMTEDWIDE